MSRKSGNTPTKVFTQSRKPLQLTKQLRITTPDVSRLLHSHSYSSQIGKSMKELSVLVHNGEADLISISILTQRSAS
jgi:hypothetical protein